ncbi:MAG: hypothetical protein EXR79_04815 [Myxococcales bacterium]|nr:hypothetical protein [Myxococcales bacterium]
MVPFFAFSVDARSGLGPVHGVEADCMVTGDVTVSFQSADRTVYSLPRRWLVEVRQFAERAEALAWLRRHHRDTAPGRGRIGEERVARRPGGTDRAAVVEGVQIVLEGCAPASGKGRAGS